MVGTIDSYAPIVVLIAVAVVMTGAIVVLTHLIGPRRKGPIKDSPYESGMPLVGDARRRLNVRFYMVAVLFLLFDVEVVFLWPWAILITRVAKGEAELQNSMGAALGAGFLLAAMGIFVGLLVIGFLYDWLRGAFRWD